MKQSNHLEIILFTNTSFAKRQLCEKNDSAQKKIDAADELEKACWSGLLFEMLPDVFDHAEKDLFIWKVNKAGQFLRIVMGPAPVQMGYETSIDPHFFLLLPRYHR